MYLKILEMHNQKCNLCKKKLQGQILENIRMQYKFEQKSSIAITAKKNPIYYNHIESIICGRY